MSSAAAEDDDYDDDLLNLSSAGPGGQILTGGAMMEGGQLGGMSLNVLPVSESENILTQEQMEADNAAVQSMEVRQRSTVC